MFKMIHLLCGYILFLSKIESTLEEWDGYMIPGEQYLFPYYRSLGG